MTDLLLVVCAVFLLVLLALSALLLLRVSKTAGSASTAALRFDSLERLIERVDRLIPDQSRVAREENAALLHRMGEAQKSDLELFRRQLVELKTETATLAKDLKDETRGQLVLMAQRIATLGEQAAQQQEQLREVVQQRLEILRVDNSAKLDQMREVVEEKLQSTLEARLGESFRVVQEQLERVHTGLGEMQTLATGVGDLKRVLSNVKTRGIWGEVHLARLLEQMLTPEQYATNVEIRPGSGQRVEFAVRLPGRDGEGEIYLPLDAKFPQDAYDRLIDAGERADPVAEAAASAELEARIRGFAKDISEKYLHPPHSTDFGILFLPTEGLYAEVLRRPGLAESLQTIHRVSVAGPTTLGAFLNSLQMGFRTLAIEKRSSEVWRILSGVKSEMAKFGDAFEKVRKKLAEATNQMDAMDTRKRVLLGKLRGVETIDGVGESLTGAMLAGAIAPALVEGEGEDEPAETDEVA